MKQKFTASLALMFAWALPSLAQIPENLVADAIPSIPAELKEDAGRYLEFRSALFQDWHPQKREILITTRFADTMQLHQVRMPRGARSQLTFFPDRVSGGSFRPKTGEVIVFSKDMGGGEFFQLYRYDFQDGKITLLTDGKSRNTGPRWSNSGKWLAYTSTQRTGRDNDVYVIDPLDPRSNRLLTEVSGGGWSVGDWVADDSTLVLVEYISINESYLHLCDVKTGARTLITPKADQKVAYSQPQFSKDRKAIYVATDKGSEFSRLTRIDLATGEHTVLTPHISWDVDDFDLSPDGRTIAFVTNEDGIGVLHLLSTRTGRETRAPKLPVGVLTGLKWHENNRDLGFTLTSAQSPADAYSVDVTTGKLDRWTESETGGLDATQFVSPELVRIKSFDGLEISGFLYRPDARKFPGPRPVLVNIHGGPEGQSRPIFLARNNYYLSELGIAILYPNVRGSSGRGKTFLTLDNGFKREDSVKDIGAFLDWIKANPQLAGDRIAVIGGSYGGYMVLGSLLHYSDKLRAGVDMVGISNFLTFLQNTQDYRRDLRRAEYGDERDEKMRVFLEQISPTKHVEKIQKPLLVIQGKNDPRVPVTESEQMVKALREKGGIVWYLMATDEGHGFAKKKNADFAFLAEVLFLKKHLLQPENVL
jgi:dipeptidyl aminopeptidase/acylaminoacyl peptidase